MISLNNFDDSDGSDIDPSNSNKGDLVSLKNFNEILSSKYTFLNDDLNLFGQYRVIEYVKGELCVNLSVVVESVDHLIRMYKEKVKVLDDCDDKIRFLDSEIVHIKKLFTRKNQEYETMATDCARLRDTLNDTRLELKGVKKQLCAEKNNIKVLNSNISRERNQFKNDKTKLEREMTVLKERLGKLLTDPKKVYPFIELNSTDFTFDTTKSGTGRKLPKEKFENLINEELISSYRRQIEDIVLENRQLREQLISHLIQLKRLSHCQTDFTSSTVIKQRNNSGLSRASSDSDISTRSNETFIVSNTKSQIDERIYLEMPFNVIREDISHVFEECYGTIDKILQEAFRSHAESNMSINTTGTRSESVDPSIENLTRLQKEIFQLRRQLIDYESIIQSKDSLIEAAIEQRVRRGSLLSNASNATTHI